MHLIIFSADELSEDVTVALRKRAEIDSKHLVVLVEHDEAEWNRSLNMSVTGGSAGNSSEPKRIVSPEPTMAKVEKKWAIR